ncbi:MAG: response regulator transcription factor, partial [Symbiobacteriaceae bacterium]|nr:response regulator transcription factor [Symbiobacteriaceae bacterium]
MPQKIMVVEDEKPIADILQYNLEKEGYEVRVVGDGREAVRETLAWQPDLLLLDLMLPSLDGISVCREVRRELPLPIIMLTAKGSESDIVNGLSAGADDYITKPFSMRILIARVQAFLRRSTLYAGEGISDTPKTPLNIGDFIMDTALYEVRKGGEKIALTLREYELLKHLALNPGRVYTREELLEQVWGYERAGGDGRTVDVTVRRLREKIEE